MQSGRAKQNEWYSKNHMGRIVCKLCTTEHRDEANFLTHIDARRHTLNLEKIAKAKEIYERERDATQRLRQMSAHDSHAAAMAGLSGGAGITATSGLASSSKLPTVGRPVVKGPLFEQQNGVCKVFFEVHYPLASSDGLSRPMHKWMSAREQSVETLDDSVIYLVFACNPYDSIAYTFPANAAISEFASVKSADVYHCDWDPVGKTYTLMFSVVPQTE
jgi:splicing factor 3A subunit 2